MVTQPGNVPKARPSHLAAVDVAYKGLSERLAFEGCPLKCGGVEV